MTPELPLRQARHFAAAGIDENTVSFGIDAKTVAAPELNANQRRPGPFRHFPGNALATCHDHPRPESPAAANREAETSRAQASSSRAAAGVSRRRPRSSSGSAKGTDAVLAEIRQIRDGGASGSIIGRNTFQRPRADAIEMLNKLIDIYRGKA